MSPTPRWVEAPAWIAATFHVAAMVVLDRALLGADVVAGALVPRLSVPTQLAHHRLYAFALAILVIVVLRVLRWPRPPWWSVPVALAGVGLGWLAVLEALLGLGEVYALGLLAVVAGGAVHLVGALAALTREGPARRALVGVLVLAASTLVTLTAAEGVFRLLLPPQIYEIVPDDWRGGEAFVRGDDGRLIGRPGFSGRYKHPEFPGVRVELNELGFRDDRSESIPPREDEDVVLVLGDSFAFGCGVELEQTFQEQVEAMAGLRMVCAALPGYGQFQQLELLHGLIDEMRPRVVVVALYEGNDLNDNMRAGAISLGLIRRPAIEPPLLRRPGLGTFFLDKVRKPTYWLGSSSAAQSIRPRIEPWLVEVGLLPKQVPTNQMLNWMLSRTPTQEVAMGQEWTTQLLGRIRDLAAGRSAVTVVLMIPAVIQASPSRFAEFVDARGGPADRYDRVGFHERFVTALLDRGFAVVDPLARITAEAEAGRESYYREGHWNARGHQIAAELLMEELRKHFEP